MGKPTGRSERARMSQSLLSYLVFRLFSRFPSALVVYARSRHPRRSRRWFANSLGVAR